MKFDRFKSFPYPVLRPYNDDFIGVEFQSTTDYSISESMIDFEITYVVSSEEIQQAINDGSAEYSTIISCRDTYSRKNIFTSQNNIRKEFSIEEFRGEVKIDSYIVVKKKIESFSSSDLNPEFGESTIKYDVGEILAQDETTVFYLEKELFKPISAVFEFGTDQNLPLGMWELDYEGKYVRIVVNPDMKKTIDEARSLRSNQVILINSLYFSAATEAIEKLKKNQTEYSEKTWAEVILKQIQNQNIDIENDESYIIAQKLMQYPLKLMPQIFNESTK